MTDQILRNLVEVRYHRATNTWSLVDSSGSVETLTQNRMRMRVQRQVKAAAAQRAAETYPEAIMSRAEIRRRAVALMEEIKVKQSRGVT